MCKEHPILFSTPMVEAIIDGRKTMTRRIVKPMRSQRWLSMDTLLKSPSAYMCIIDGDDWAQFRHPLAGQFAFGVQNEEDSPLTCIKHPYGNIGDVLYVRETWQHTDSLGVNREDENSGYIYKASENGREWESSDDNWIWKPSIFLPKEGSRIWIQISDIKMERLQDISQEDARLEGILPAPHRPSMPSCPLHKDKSMHRDCFVCAFKTLWNKINGKSGNGWLINPWVWAISYNVLSTTGRPNSIPVFERSVATEAK